MRVILICYTYYVVTFVETNEMAATYIDKNTIDGKKA